MQKAIFPEHIWKLFKYSLCLVLLVFLTTCPVYAADSQINNTDVTDKIRIHMETAGLKDTEIDEKLRQLEEKLKAGLSIKDSCIHCHLKQAGKP